MDEDKIGNWRIACFLICFAFGMVLGIAMQGCKVKPQEKPPHMMPKPVEPEVKGKA